MALHYRSLSYVTRQMYGMYRSSLASLPDHLFDLAAVEQRQGTHPRLRPVVAPAHELPLDEHRRHAALLVLVEDLSAHLLAVCCARRERRSSGVRVRGVWRDSFNCFVWHRSGVEESFVGCVQGDKVTTMFIRISTAIRVLYRNPKNTRKAPAIPRQKGTTHRRARRSPPPGKGRSSP